ncbi:MAG: dockerin type I domain-containing protein [Sedimentisphaerales bacterium]
MHRTILWLSFAILFSLSGRVFGVSWDNGDGNNLWSDPINWSGNVLPAITDGISITMTSGPLINSPTTALGYQIRVGAIGGANLTMNSGTLNAGEWLMIGNDASNQPGSFTMNGGTINLGQTTAGNGHLWIGYKSSGTFTMNGGTINAPGRFGLAWSTGGAAFVYLNDGTIYAHDFSMTSTCSIDITNGILILDGDQRTTVNGYVGNGWIKAAGGTGTVSVDYNITNPGKTTIRAYIDPTKAKSPSPANNAVDVIPDANLSWMAGDGAVSHNVYFGISNPPVFQNNQTATTFDPGVLDFNTTYYWRIDEVNGPNTVTGDVWSFTTVSGLAKNPDPSNGAANVARDKVLSWTAGYDAVSHDVYLGTDANSIATAERLAGDLDGDGRVDYNDLAILAGYWLQNPAGSEPYAGVNDDNIVDFFDYAILAGNWMAQTDALFKGNTTAASYDDPCSFASSTTYYWRIDEVNGAKRRKGSIWSFTTTAVDSNYSLVGKIMCGYQGWFNCPGDGTSRGWVHWGPGSFSPSSCTVDMWPDMNEMSAGENFLASSFYDGNNYYVFSSHNRNTVLRHFQWMQQYGIDGVYLQRFATEVTPGSASFNHRNDVLSYCKDGANMYGRKYAVMYDLSGLNAGETSKVITDWQYLVDTKKVGKDPNDHGYMFHNGKPVVAIWGLGFGRAYEGQESYNLINFFKNDRAYGGNVVMLGVNDTWRTNSDSWFQQTLLLGDIISPWLVGRYSNTSGVNNWATSKGVPDKNWCNNNGKDYLPVMFPGFSWHNLNGGPLNQIPRNGGQFLWDQLYADISIVGANMIYVAMFDEVDEGTAIFKVSNNPPRPGGVDMFVTPDFDGYPLPSDEYLWLTDQAGRGLRGEISPVPSTRPAR